jgi:hypothetical protein
MRRNRPANGVRHLVGARLERDAEQPEDREHHFSKMTFSIADTGMVVWENHDHLAWMEARANKEEQIHY